MPKVQRIPTPVRGLSDGYAFEDQPPLTTQDAQNCRSIDPKTGRVRLSQRSGTSRYTTSRIQGDNFGQDLRPLTYDRPRVTYTVLRNSNTNITEEWAKAQAGSSECVALAVSSVGDVYAVAGRELVEVYNSTGTLLQTIQVPLPSEDLYVRDVEIDAAGNLYICAGADDADTNRYEGEVYRYTLNESDELELAWTLEIDGECPDIAVGGDKLHVIANKLDTSTLEVYTALAASAPRLLWSRAIPNPSIQLDVDPSGNVFVSSPPNANRGQVGGQAWCGTKDVDWTPTDTTDVPSGIRWSWHRAEDIAGRADGDEVDIWLDYWGDRAFFGIGDQDGKQNPLYRIDALCGEPGVYFNGTNSGMTTTIGGGSETTSSLSALPGYNDVAWVRCMILRPTRNAGRATYEVQGGDVNYRWSVHEAASGNPGAETDPNAEETRFYTNRSSTAGSPTPAGIPIGANWNPDPDGDDNPGNILIETTIHVGDDVYGAASNERSQYRVNGEKIGEIRFTRERAGLHTGIGYNYGRESDGFYDGFIIERVCLAVSKSQVPATYDLEDLAEKLEGYLAWKYGVQDVLPSAHPYDSATGAPTASGTSTDPDGADNGDLELLKETKGIVAKFSAGGGELRWAEAGSGVGHAVRVDDSGRVWTTGESASGNLDDGVTAISPASVMCRLLIDQGDTFSESGGDGAWAVTVPDPQNKRTRIDFDREGNVYIPSDNDEGLYKIDVGGTLEANKQFGSPTQKCLAVRMDSLTYDKDYKDENIKEPEFCYLGTQADSAGAGESTLRKVKLVDSAVEVGAPRQTRLLGVANGYINRKNGAGWATPTGGTSALSSESKIVRSIAYEGKAYFIDGVTAKVYDPIADEVTDWKATSSGELPRLARLIERWRGRVLLARTSGEPTRIYMSKIADANNWNYFPAVPRRDQATFIVCPGGIVNAMIPYSDDLLIVGTDHELWRFTGDPMSNGEWDRISDVTGMAFGRPWAVDEQGTIYFAGSRGGIFRLRPGGLPERMTADRIDRRLDVFDFNAYTFRLEWNDQDEALHCYPVPIDVVAAVTNDPPAVTITSPTANADFAVGASVSFAGTATDTEDGTITGSLAWSSDLDGSIGTGGSFSTSALSEGVHVITASVTDSDGNTTAATRTIFIGDTSPLVNITAPIEGGAYGGTSTIGFAATAIDEQDGDLSASLVWTSSREGQIGTGASFSRVLIVGSHVITASVTDSDDNEGSDFVTITVRPGTDPPIITKPNTFNVFGFGPQSEGPESVAASVAPQKSWVWERRTDSWWEDVFPTSDMDVTACVVMDGDDPDDRVLLLAGADGYLRKWDRAAADDDDNDTAMTSYCLIGPLSPGSLHDRGRFSGFDFAMAAGQNGAVVRFYASDQADDIGSQVGPNYAIATGRNNTIRLPVRGQSVWIEVVNETAGERWAVEAIAADVAEAGRVRS
ncbi:MAG: hypothetical protein RIB60_06105 [Phycisphaerales bacterium]